MSVKRKIETLEEFLARGGAITKVAPGEVLRQVEVTRKTAAGGPAVIMSLEEGELYFGEVRKGSKLKKAKSTPAIDLNALPEALRAKFINKLKEEANGEENEVSSSEEDDSDD